jgi:hypothetical protein
MVAVCEDAISDHATGAIALAQRLMTGIRDFVIHVGATCLILSLITLSQLTQDHWKDIGLKTSESFK